MVAEEGKPQNFPRSLLLTGWEKLGWQAGNLSTLSVAHARWDQRGHACL